LQWLLERKAVEARELGELLLDLAVDVTQKVDIGHYGRVPVFDEVGQQVAFAHRVALLHHI